MQVIALNNQADNQYDTERLNYIRAQARAELVRRLAADKNILEWGKVLFPEKFTLPFCKEMHEYFISIRKEEFTNTEAPRNHAKTIIKCFLIPMFQALNEPRLYKHYLNVQSTSTKATGVNLSIRAELETNELLRDVYGDMFNETKWTEKQFVMNNGVVFTAIGTGESLRGINYNNIRPDYIVVDDLYDESDINNSEAVKKKNTWFWSSLYFARAKTKNCCIHVQGTAIHKVDLLEELKKKKRWHSKTFRAIEDFDTKKVLWKELNTFDDLMADKDDTSSTIFYREMQNERRDEDSSIIKESYLKFYNGIIPDGEIVVEKILGCDPSIGQHKHSDYTGIATVYKTRTVEGIFKYYVVGLINQHLSMDARIKTLEALHGREQFTKAYIEGIAGFKDFVAEVKRRTTIPVTEVDSVKDKITNLENKSHYFENGKVIINRNIEKCLLDKFIEQLTNNYPENDDMRDALLLCITEKSKWLGTAKATHAIN